MSLLDDLLPINHLEAWSLPDDPPDDDGHARWPAVGGSDLATPP